MEPARIHREPDVENLRTDFWLPKFTDKARKKAEEFI